MCAVLSSVYATTVDYSGVYVYYLKGIVSVCFTCPARTVGFSGTRPYLPPSTVISCFKFYLIPVVTAVDNSSQESALSVIRGPTGSRE